MTETNGSNGTMKGLPPELIAKLVANSRSRGVYPAKLDEFNSSDEAAINPREVWPVEFGGKEATSLYQGFLNAAKKHDPPLNDVITVKKDGEDVFLMHNERVQAVILAAQED